MAQDRGANVTVTDTTTQFGCLGVWGPNARATIQKIADEPESWSHENFPFAALRNLTIKGVPVLAFRISYVGEQGWELHFKYEDGLALWDALYALGVTPVGVETYANSRRMEKSLRLQNGDLLTEYNLMECDLARPKVKAADFHGKEAHMKFREREHQPATLCTLTMTHNIDSTGVARLDQCVLDKGGGGFIGVGHAQIGLGHQLDAGRAAGAEVLGPGQEDAAADLPGIGHGAVLEGRGFKE